MAGDTCAISAAAAKLPLSMTLTNIAMPASLSTIAYPLVSNDDTNSLFINRRIYNMVIMPAPRRRTSPT
ncbi:hypothetical protein ACOJBM_04450 [Rhizobium beringeri]